jgi:DNA repair photolyase
MSMEPILYANPVALFQGMWATGIMLNCNVYHSCTTGCRYCYVALNRAAERLRHAVPACTDPFAGLGKFTNLVNKVFGPRYNERNATEYFLHERWPMMLSNNSDPLSDLEAEHGFTRQYLQVLADLEYPVQILTKGQAWQRVDRDAWIALLRRFPRLWVSVTITADNEDCRVQWEPNGSSIDDRFAMVRELADAGINVEVHCTPFIPRESFRGGAWDDPETYRGFLGRVKDSGAFGVTVAPLCLDAVDARVVDAGTRAYVKANGWCNSATDRPWRFFLPDVSVWQMISSIWYAEAKALGLQCGLHPAFVSLCGDGAELQSSCCTPPWVDKAASWIASANRLRALQDSLDAPVLVSTRTAAQWQAARTAFADHVFDWKSLAGLIPHGFRDETYSTQVNTMPAQVTVETLVRFQLEQMCRWSDSLWSDQVAAPIEMPDGGQGWDSDMGYIISYDRNRPRDSWAVCRGGYGWNGRSLGDVAGAKWHEGTTAITGGDTP